MNWLVVVAAMSIAASGEAVVAAADGEPAATQAAQIDALPPLTKADLIAMASTVRSFRPKSVFDAAPQHDLKGRRFEIELPVRPAGAGGCVSMPSWRYSAERRELELVFFGALRLGGAMKSYSGKVHPVLQDTGSYLSAPVSCLEVRAGYYRASNLFGATTTISRKGQSVIEVATARDPLKSEQTDFIMATVSMSPDEARAILPKIRLRYEGFFSRWPTGTSVACGIEHLTPDMNTVWDTVVNTCIYRGFVSRVAFVDISTGKTLVERKFDLPDAQRL